jgi:predicted PurR-regulated permease PerM
MRLSRPDAVWFAAIAVVLLLIVLLRAILLPFVVGMALAYLLDPLVNRLERFGMNRLAAALGIVSFYLIVLGALIFVAVPILVGEFAVFVEGIPGDITRLQSLMLDPMRPWLGKIVADGLDDVQKSTGELATLGAGWVTASLRSLWSSGPALISILSVLVVAPIVAIYLIHDWKRLIWALDGSIPAAHRKTVRALFREIDDTISGFVRGQSLVCLILALYYATALTLCGLRHGFIIGLTTGLVSFIPYLGSLTGLLLSLIVAIADFGPHWTPILLIAGIFLIGQSLSDYVLSPYFVGRRVNLNPVLLMFALFAFGYLFGFVGLLIAVPLAATIGVFVRVAVREYAPALSDAPSIAPNSD